MVQTSFIPALGRRRAPVAYCYAVKLQAPKATVSFNGATHLDFL